MMKKIVRGDSYVIPVGISQDGNVVTPDLVSEVTVFVGSAIQKRMSQGDVVYENGQWYFRLSQEESLTLEDCNNVYVRVVYPGSHDDIVTDWAGRIACVEVL